MDADNNTEKGAKDMNEALARERELGRMETELQHLHRSMDEIRKDNKESIAMIRSVQESIVELAHQKKAINEFKNDVSKKFNEIEAQLTQLTNDLNHRRGISGFLNTLGVQAPFWAFILLLIGGFLAWWLAQQGAPLPTKGG